MSSPIPYNLTQQKLQQLLAAARLNRAYTDVTFGCAKIQLESASLF